MWDNGLCAHRRDAFNNPLGCRRPHPEARLDRTHIDAAAKPHQLAAPFETLERLIDRCAVSKMQELLGADQSAFRKSLGLVQDTVSDGSHRNSCQKYSMISD